MRRQRAETAGQGTESEARLGRRALLRTGLNAGVAAGLVWAGGADYVSSGDAGTITYALARPGPDSGSLRPRRTEVPPVWHESVRLAFAAQKRIRDASLEPLLDSFVVPGTYDDPTASLAMRATSESVTDPLDDLAESIPVDLDVVEPNISEPKTRFQLGDAHQIRDLDPRAIPGGVICKGTEVYGTLAPALFDADRGTRYFATSNHVYVAGGATATSHVGEPLWILSDDEEFHVGNVVGGYPAVDIVRVAPVGDYRPATAIDRASPSRVVGQYTKMGLADLAARDEPLVKMGALSDLTTGPIRGVDGLTCYVGRACKTGQLIWGDSNDLTDGDSGSVTYHPDPAHPDEFVLVGGVNNARTRWLGDFTWGTAAYHLSDEYGLHF